MTVAGLGPGFANAINAGGEIAGGVFTADVATGGLNSQSVVFNSRGELDRVLEGEGEAEDINDSGVVVGWHDVQSNRRAVVWDRQGRVSELPMLPDGRRSLANAINNSGVIVGYVTQPRRFIFGGFINTPQAVVWNPNPSGGYSVTRLPSLPDVEGSVSSEATGINEAALIVGNVNAYEAGEFHVVTWDSHGNLTDVGEQTPAVDVNDTGQILGESAVLTSLVGGGYAAVPLPGLPGSDGYVVARTINNRGEVAGFGRSSTAGSGQSAILWRPAPNGSYAAIGLDGLPGWTSTEARDISIQGQVVGISSVRSTASNTDDAVRWDQR